MRHTCAMNMTVVASYRAVPFMFTVVPRGKTNFIMLSSHPASAAQSIATCIEAYFKPFSKLFGSGKDQWTAVLVLYIDCPLQAACNLLRLGC